MRGVVKCNSATAEHVLEGGREDFDRICVKKRGRAIGKDQKMLGGKQPMIDRFGMGECKASVTLIWGGESSLLLCNFLPLLPSTSPGKRSAFPGSCSYLLSYTSWGRRVLRIWLLFLLVHLLIGAMWVPQLSLTSPRASFGSHNSSFLAPGDSLCVLLKLHSSLKTWRSAASCYYFSLILKAVSKVIFLIEALFGSQILMLEKENHVKNKNLINKVIQLHPEKVKLHSDFRGAHLPPSATEDAAS